MIVARVLYLIAPLVLAGVVQAAVIKRRLWPALARPLDGGRMYRGRPIFGVNKTWRGVIVMSAASLAGTFVQHELARFGAFRTLGLVGYSTPRWLELGVALGAGYSLAELPNSFLKRRLSIPPGARSRHRAQYLADQADSALGGTLALSLFLWRAPATLALVFTVGLTLHVLMDRALYASGVKTR